MPNIREVLLFGIKAADGQSDNGQRRVSVNQDVIRYVNAISAFVTAS